MNGALSTSTKLRFMQAAATHEAAEVGVRRPDHTPVKALGPGETGYLIHGIKDVREARSGETVTETSRQADAPLEGSRHTNPRAFCGVYPLAGDQDRRSVMEEKRVAVR